MCLSILTIYVISYVIVWRNRVPAADMAYFAYSENDNLDHVAYVFFYPVQRVHRWFDNEEGNWHYRDFNYPTDAEIRAP